MTEKRNLKVPFIHYYLGRKFILLLITYIIINTSHTGEIIQKIHT